MRKNIRVIAGIMSVLITGAILPNVINTSVFAEKSITDEENQQNFEDENSEKSEGDFKYIRLDDHIIINSYSGTDDSVKIPETIEGLPVTVINSFAFDHCNMSQIIIPDTVKVISESAFRSCNNIKEFNIPENVEQLGNIYPDFFDDCNGLCSISVDEKNKFFCSVDGVLYNKDKSQLIGYPCQKDDENFIVPESVIDLPDEAFSNCKNLRNIKIAGNCRKMGSWIFSECENLVSVDLGKSEGAIDGFSFLGCSSLTNITVSDENKVYSSVDGMLLSKDKTKFIFFTPGYNNEEYIIPESVKTICSYSFIGTNKLKTLIFSEGVKNIEEYAFVYNYRGFLEKIFLPDSLEYIGEGAFKCFSRLEYIEFGINITDIKFLDWFYRDICFRQIVIKNPECTFSEIYDQKEQLLSMLSNNTTISSYWNSSARDFCSQYKIKFDVITEENNEKGIYGDINGDKTVDLIDLVTLSLYLLGDRDFDRTQKKLADVKLDGLVDILDLSRLRQYVMNDRVVLGRL